MCGRGNDVSVFYGIVKQTSSNKTCGVSHVNHQKGTYLVGNFAHTFVIPFTTISTTTTNNQFGFVFQCQLLHFVVVNTTCFRIQVISDGFVQYTTRVHGRTMREVSTMSEIESEECIARFQYCEQHGSICLSTRVRLYVGVFCIKEFANTVDSQLLYFVYHLATAIIAFPRIAFGVFVG